MANNNGSCQFVKKDNKLDAFLKRHLDVNTFERVRAHDSCLVCSEKENRAFKFVILTDEWLYLTENPPKNLYETVHLRDIVSINMVNDFPSFLSGAERENVQHIVVKYLATESRKRKGGVVTKGRRGVSTSGSDVASAGGALRRVSLSAASAAASASASPRSGRKPGKGNPSIIQPYSRQSLSARDTREVKVASARRSLAALSLNGGLSTRSTSALADLHLSPCQTGPARGAARSPSSASLRLPDSQELKKVQFGSHSTTKSPRVHQSVSQYLTVDGGASALDRSISPILKKKSRPPPSLPSANADSGRPRPLPSPSGSYTSLNDGTYNTRKNSVDDFPDQLELKLDLSRLKGSDEEGEEFMDIEQSTGEAEVSPGESLTPRPARSSMATEEAENGVRETVIHFYIMSGASNFFMLAKTAWRNYLVRGTLEEDPRYVVRVTPQTAQPASEKLELLFRQLKMELLHPANTMETTFHLLDELKVATERTFTLKKLFWKSPESFLFLVRQLHKYVPVSPCCTDPAETGDSQAQAQRADELDFVIHILETLALMFRETEIMSSRTQILQGSAGRAARDLLAVLACSPGLASTAQRQSSWILNDEPELTELQDEYIRTAASVLFELLLVAEQAYWSSSNVSTISVNWLVQQLDELPTTDQFVSALVKDVLVKITRNKSDSQLTPNTAVLLYQELTIIKTLVTNSARILAFIRNNFMEEFKYFIRSPVVSKQLPSHYLIRPYIIDTLDDVINDVLQRPVQLAA